MYSVDPPGGVFDAGNAVDTGAGAAGAEASGVRLLVFNCAAGTEASDVTFEGARAAAVAAVVDIAAATDGAAWAVAGAPVSGWGSLLAWSEGVVGAFSFGDCLDGPSAGFELSIIAGEGGDTLLAAGTRGGEPVLIAEIAAP